MRPISTRRWAAFQTYTTTTREGKAMLVHIYKPEIDRLEIYFEDCPYISVPVTADARVCKFVDPVTPTRVVGFALDGVRKFLVPPAPQQGLDLGIRNQE